MRVLTWNIQWGKGRDGRVDLRRVAETIHGHAPDVICLQEVAVNHPTLTGGSDDQVAQIAALFPGFVIAFASASDLSDGQGGRSRFGNLLLSRLPLLEVTRQRLPFPGDPAVPAMPRVALEAVIDAPWGALRVVSTHLEYYSRLQRTAQIAALRALHAEASAHAARPRAAESDAHYRVSPRGAECVLCGDFNCVPEAPELDLLCAPYASTEPAGPDHPSRPVPPAPTFAHAWRVLHPAAPFPPTAGLVASPYFSQPLCYDHVFVSAGLWDAVRSAYVDDKTDASDHQPWIVDLISSS